MNARPDPNFAQLRDPNFVTPTSNFESMNARPDPNFAAFTVGCVPVGFAVMCQLASHPSALTMRFLSVASHLLHSGFLQTRPRGLALAFGSWLSLLS